MNGDKCCFSHVGTTGARGRVPAGADRERRERRPDHKSWEFKAYLGDISRDAHNDDTNAFVKKFGNPLEVFNSGKGYSFVKFGTAEEAQSFVEKINGKELCGQPVRANTCPKQRTAGSGGRGVGGATGRGGDRDGYRERRDDCEDRSGRGLVRGGGGRGVGDRGGDRDGGRRDERGYERRDDRGERDDRGFGRGGSGGGGRGFGGRGGDRDGGRREKRSSEAPNLLAVPPTPTVQGLAPWSPFSKYVTIRGDGSLQAFSTTTKNEFFQWSVGVMELPMCSEVTIYMDITNGGLNLIALVPPKDDFYSGGKVWTCGQQHRAPQWGAVVSDEDNIDTPMHGLITVALNRRVDSETTCTITNGGVTSVLRGFPREYLLAIGLCHGNIVRVISIDSAWLRRRGYLMVLLLSLGGRATGGTDGTAVLLARLAHLPWDIVEHVFQWM